jgi:phospholipid/cholesterol/gamma-HCH transport system substrate-binding protein
MSNTRKIEIAIGLLIVMGLAALLLLALRVSNLTRIERDGQGYELTAEFLDVGALPVNAPVRVSGVTVGRVARVDLDPETLEARVTLRIGDRYRLPRDTSARIYTQGILGSEYVALRPGADKAVLGNGDRITRTEPALVLEKAIDQFLYGEAEGAK